MVILTLVTLTMIEGALTEEMLWLYSPWLYLL